jgi:hypothetical protein
MSELCVASWLSLHIDFPTDLRTRLLVIILGWMGKCALTGTVKLYRSVTTPINANIIGLGVLARLGHYMPGDDGGWEFIKKPLFWG